MVGEPPSASLAAAEQVKVELVVRAVEGEMPALVMKIGALFCTVTLPEVVSVPPSVSVAVAVQVMLSDGDAFELVKVRLGPLARLDEPLVQA
jgi:hypothetical protein